MEEESTRWGEWRRRELDRGEWRRALDRGSGGGQYYIGRGVKEESTRWGSGGEN